MAGNMTGKPRPSNSRIAMLSRLRSDKSANTLALAAAALVPIIGMVGGGVDMSRAYLANSRLQQACDAGVLAARQRLGSSVAVDGAVPADVAEVGQRFFNINYRDGIYATEDRDFTMTLENDYTVSGVASVEVPTALMGIFGIATVPVDVECEARLSFPNLDIMMALDVTGSMRHTNSGDSLSRMESLKATIRKFHGQLEGSKAPGVRLRYGFLPYATNVNVGHLLEDSWLVDDWTYQSRILEGTVTEVQYHTLYRNWEYQSGAVTDWEPHSTYDATFVEGTPASGGANDEVTTGTSDSWQCTGAQPAHTITADDVTRYTETEEVTDPDGTRTIYYKTRTENGILYRTRRDGESCIVESRTYTDLVNDFEQVHEPRYVYTSEYRYMPVAQNVENWRSEVGGCIEERATYKITDKDSVDLTQALDLDIDLVPDNTDATKWRPRYPSSIYARSLATNGTGTITPEEVVTTSNFAKTGEWWFSDCPAPAVALAEMDAGEVDTFLSTLNPTGATYHDIGMIWAARMISSTGPFATQNADVTPSNPSSRNIIFLTDGQTEAFDISYGAYGLEALDNRRWEPGDALSLVETVELRFTVACLEARKRNIAVWVIAFGTSINQSMVDCAGEGRYFEASDSDTLDETFSKIADSLGDLRVSK